MKIIKAVDMNNNNNQYDVTQSSYFHEGCEVGVLHSDLVVDRSNINIGYISFPNPFDPSLTIKHLLPCITANKFEWYIDNYLNAESIKSSIVAAEKLRRQGLVDIAATISHNISEISLPYRSLLKIRPTTLLLPNYSFVNNITFQCIEGGYNNNDKLEDNIRKDIIGLLLLNNYSTPIFRIIDNKHLNISSNFPCKFVFHYMYNVTSSFNNPKLIKNIPFGHVFRQDSIIFKLQIELDSSVHKCYDILYSVHENFYNVNNIAFYISIKERIHRSFSLKVKDPADVLVNNRGIIVLHFQSNK